MQMPTSPMREERPDFIAVAIVLLWSRLFPRLFAAGSGGGTGTGVGTGSGPGSGGGGLARDPEPRQLLLPPEVKDKDQRGTFLNVTFFVRPDGRVQRVDVEPEPKNRKYAREFRERMEGYLFRPARSAEGSAVAGIFHIKVGL